MPDIFATQCYVLGEKDFKSSPAVEQNVRDLVLRWEAHDKPVWKLWSHVLAYSYEGIERTLARLGNRWDKVWHEHEHYEDGKKFVKKGLAASIFKKLDDGAVLTDLARFNIPDTILLKNDGTALYITQDIALTALKKKTYRADKLVWVIGPEQALAMKQLFAICEQLGIGARADFTHIPYGYVGLSDSDGNFQKMSSREGTVVLIDDVIDAAREKILAVLKENAAGEKSAEKIDPRKQVETAEKLALAAVKFSILKSERTRDIAFDVQQSVETKGDSGVYVLYTYARAKSIVRKAQHRPKMRPIAPKQEKMDEFAAQRDISRLLIFFPQVVARSLADFSVHHIAQFLLELSAAFNAWYAHEMILDGGPNEQQKLALVAATAQVIKNGLAIMGISTVEEI